MPTPNWGARRTREEWLRVMNNMGAGHGTELEKEQVLGSAWEEILNWKTLGLWNEGDYIVDIGSGNGRLAIPWSEFDVKYLGIEPMQECVDYCKAAFREWPNIRFQHVDLQNDMYNPTGTIQPQTFRFPVGDGEADVLIFGSVYTHLSTLDVADRYVRETWRSLRPGGRAWLSWFRSPPNPLSTDPTRTVYREADILNLIRAFEVVETGGGLQEGFHDQWCMLLRKPA